MCRREAAALTVRYVFGCFLFDGAQAEAQVPPPGQGLGEIQSKGGGIKIGTAEFFCLAIFFMTGFLSLFDI